MEKEKKKSTKKKILKWFAGIFIVLLIGVLPIPVLFKDKIVALVTKTANNNLNATVSYKDSDLSIFSNFPSLSLSLNHVAVTNKAPFLGDTLYSAEHLYLNMGLFELFKTNDPIKINSIKSENGFVNILINEDNIGNYDIAIKKETNTNSTTNNSFSFDINSYELSNMHFRYVDKTTNNEVTLDSIYHTGKGNFGNDIFNLDTNTEAILSLVVNNTSFLKNIAVKLNAILALDINNLKYTFKENKGFINQLPLEFQGFIQLVDNNQLYDLTFKTPTSSFTNALGLFPEEITGNLKSIQTEGNFDLNGFFKGTLSDNTIPSFNIAMSSKNAMFKYKDLPKAVKNIFLEAEIINKTGLAKDTYLAANKLSFKIDEDIFNASGSVSNISNNPFVNLKANGIINLANISKVYPVSIEKQLEGVLKANITTAFDMNAIEKKNYARIKNSGEISINNFKYEGDDVANPFYINTSKVNFNSNNIQLTEFNAKTGNSDLALKGSLNNFYGFLFNNEQLKGNFSLNSNTIKVDDFLSKSSSTGTEKKSTLKIPSFLDISVTAKADNVIYDNINLKNMTGNLSIKEESVILKQLNTSVFGGNIDFSGNISTKENNPKFSMDIALNQLNIKETFSKIDMLASIAPIANTIQGNLNSSLNVSGLLTDDMTPNLNTITGKLFGELLNTKLNADNSKTLSLLSSKLNFLDANKLNLNNLKGYFSFENGIVTIKPIPISYKDINMTIGGKHGFDKSIDYNINFEVPVSYLGTDITKAIAKLTPKDAKEIKTIPIKAIVNGSFTSPKITTNINEATKNLMNTIIEKQKQSLKDKGKDKIKDLLGLKKQDSLKKDSIKKADEILKDKAKKALLGLFGKKKKDTTKQN